MARYQQGGLKEQARDSRFGSVKLLYVSQVNMHQDQEAPRETMPKWPAWVLFATMAACAYPAVASSADASQPAPHTAEQTASLASTIAR